MASESLLGFRVVKDPSKPPGVATVVDAGKPLWFLVMHPDDGIVASVPVEPEDNWREAEAWAYIILRQYEERRRECNPT